MEDKKEQGFDFVRVSGTTGTKQLAASIFAAVTKGKPGLVLRGVGASAISQMAKAFAKAKTDLSGQHDITVDIRFADVPDKHGNAGDTITAMEFVVTVN
jgi:stage V sporulation protein SpoVS